MLFFIFKILFFIFNLFYFLFYFILFYFYFFVGVCHHWGFGGSTYSVEQDGLDL